MTKSRPSIGQKPAPAGEASIAILRERVEAQVAALAEPILAGLGYALVRVQLAGARGGLTLQLMAERQDGRAMLVEDCRIITQAVDVPLDEADLIPGAYALEVSSPGIDRPLTREKDFADWAGFEAKISLDQPLDGRKNFRGLLQGLQDNTVRLQVDGKNFVLPLARIVKAQLVLTDELIKATAAREAVAGAKQRN